MRPRAAGSRGREGARYVAERRVRIAEVAAGTAAAQREIDRLDEDLAVRRAHHARWRN